MKILRKDFCRHAHRRRPRRRRRSTLPHRLRHPRSL